MNDLWDVQALFAALQPLTHPRTRLILNAYSRLWGIPLGIARRDESGERPVEGLAADHRAVLVVCLGEARIDADRERMGP